MVLILIAIFFAIIMVINFAFFVMDYMTWRDSRSNTKKYEVSFIMSHSGYIEDKLKSAQDAGWEIAGDILIKNEDGHATHTYLFIPLKRKLDDYEKTLKNN